MDREANTGAVNLSVVVAFCGIAGESEDWLGAWDDACSQGAEVIVASSSEELRVSARSHPNIQFVHAPMATLAPHLWAVGLEAARGSLVALTTSHFVPAQGYFAAAVAAHQQMPAAGIGGSITPPFGQGSTAWAVYLLRYGQYLTYRTVREVEDFAGDNGVYKHAALAPYLDLIRQRGFWEHELHGVLRADGLQLAFDPSIEVSQIGCFGFGRFLRQRFRHGFLYGQRLAIGQSIARRTALVCRSTLVPALLVYRTARHVLQARLRPAALGAALPALVCFAAAWGVGEGLGCLFANDSESSAKPTETPSSPAE